MSGKTKVDIIITPLLTILTGSAVGLLFGPPISKAMQLLGELINIATQQQPFLMGILVSVIMGMVLTLPISSAALGIILNLTKATKYVPEVGIYSGHFSGIVTPLSMLILGIKMANVKLGAIFTKLAVYFVSAVKLICMPALGVAILFLVKLIYAVDADMLIGFFIAFAMPTAGLASTFSDRYDGDTENAVAFTLGSTIFSIATIPVLYWLLCLLVY